MGDLHMKIIKEIKNGFSNFHRRACTVLIVGLSVSALLFLISIALYLVGGVREQNMLTYFASITGEYAFNAVTLGVMAAFFVDIIERSAENKK